MFNRREAGLLWIVSMYFYFVFITTPQFTIAQNAAAADKKCSAAENCTSCLLQDSECTWCYKMSYKASQRCDAVNEHKSRGCPDISIVSPNSHIRFKQNASVRNAGPSEPAVQLSPQKVKLKLYPGRPVKFNIAYRIADDYPVDLYYIMDLSFSMKDDKENLIRLGVDMAAELKKITRNVRLGFGAFVDKPVMPFMGTRPESLANPCYPFDQCEPTYGFTNRLSLTNDTSVFGNKVRETPISGNQDGPEGGMDALLQAMMCASDIGWRSDSRKIIVYSTDAKSHIAADAKIAGIVTPNDGYCHLANNEYTHSLRQDYPSISQIASIARQTSTNIIFAITNHAEEYRRIAQLIPSSVVGELAKDSSNIVTLVKDQYYSLIKTVILDTTGLSESDGLTFKLWNNCSSGEMEESASCDGVRIGQLIHYQAELSISSCKLGYQQKRFKIKPQDLSDSMVVDVEINCDCDCHDKIPESDECSGKGTFQCGTCDCDEGLSGDRCECDSSTHQSISACLNPLTNISCSGYGECGSCGTCQCDCLPGESDPDCDRYSGQFCECNIKSCDRKDGLLCGGKGECKCEESKSQSYCECEAGFLGQDCSCPVSSLNCRPANGTGEVCNGKGECTCGECECTDGCYEGKTCDLLKPECSRTCRSFRECVVCKVRPEEASSCLDNSLCSTYNLQLGSDLIDITEEDICFHTDLQECKHYYKYQYSHDDNTWTVYIDNVARCQKDYWLEIIIGICVGVLLLGILALVIWKVVVTAHDKRELAKFENETKKAKWNSTNNPLYKPATSTFQNPTYNGNGNGNSNSMAKPVAL